MSLGDQIFALYRSQGAQSCQRLLDERSPGKDQEERRSIAYWRAFLLERDGRYSEALAVLDAAAADSNSQSLLALKRAELLRSLGRVSEAIATLRSAPIAQEVATFPGLAWEAAYFCCYLVANEGKPPPKDLFDLIPNDFETMIDNRFLNKSDLVHKA
jgi:hypothetical protein